jgi:hypothetical protein
MKRVSLLLSLLAVAVMAFGGTTAQADDISLDLEYNTIDLDWDLYAEVLINGGLVDGSNGISAVRALIDNVDFGTLGDAVTIASGIGAIDPVITNSGPRDPVIQQTDGTLDIIYGQDISDTLNVVGLVGVGSRWLIASGTFASAGTPPAWGTDDPSGLTSQGLFLSAAAGESQGGALDPDNMVLNPMVIVDEVFGDYDDSGATGQGDLNLVLQNWGDTSPPVPAGWINDQPTGIIGQTNLNAVLQNWGNSVVASASAVPEPTTLLLSLLGLSTCGFIRRHNSRA